jgi:hypothetical protein
VFGKLSLLQHYEILGFLYDIRGQSCVIVIFAGSVKKSLFSCEMTHCGPVEGGCQELQLEVSISFRLKIGKINAILVALLLYLFTS